MLENKNEEAYFIVKDKNKKKKIANLSNHRLINSNLYATISYNMIMINIWSSIHISNKNVEKQKENSK